MAETIFTSPLTVADAAAIAAVHAAMESAEPVDALFTETDVLEQLTSPSVDLPNSSVGVYDGGDLIGFGLLWVGLAGPVWKAVLFGGVQPRHNGRGIGRRIVTELEAMALRDRNRDAPGRDGELKVYVHDKRVAAAHLVTAAGYRAWRYFSSMRRELIGPLPKANIPYGIEIRPYRDSDEEPLLTVSNESFADHWGSTPMDLARWRAEFSASAAARPRHSWVALADGDIVAFVLSEEYDGDTQLRGYRTGYLSRIGTLRRVRGRGVATALITRTLEGMAADGYRCAELDVDAASPTGAGRIYQRLGFAPFDRTTLYGKRF